MKHFCLENKKNWERLWHNCNRALGMAQNAKDIRIRAEAYWKTKEFKEAFLYKPIGDTNDQR